jgi:cysteine desulfurase family protein
MIYLDNAATSHPKPETVYEKVNHILRTLSANPGRSGHSMAIGADRVIFEARETVARFFGIRHTERIIFTPNATAALNLALNGLLEPGDECITTGMEHNSVVRPLRFLSQAGVGVIKVPASNEGVLNPKDILGAVTDKTRLIAITHASNVIGTITPVWEIAEAARGLGIPVLLDAAQTAGSVAIDVEGLGIDMLACPGHKGLYGPQGTGFLYISPKLRLRPVVFGGTGSRSDLEKMPDFLPDRHEAGTLNTPGIAGLAAGIEYIMETSIAKVRGHEIMLCGRLMDGLSAINGLTIYGVKDPMLRASVVSFNIDGVDPAAVGNTLDSEYHIAVRVGIHCAPDAHRTIGSYPTGAVRMSPGFFNITEDIDRAVEAVKAIASPV